MFETRGSPARAPARGPDRLLIGSEGILGIVTQAWMRLQDRPKFRGGGAVQFADFFYCGQGFAGDLASRIISGELPVSSIRRRRSTPAPRTAVWRAPLVAFESGDHPVEPWMARALSNAAPITAARRSAPIPDAHREGAAGAWRNAFIRMPYARERTMERTSSTRRSRRR